MRAAHSIFAALACWLASTQPSVAGPALLYEATSKQVLYAEKVDQPWFPASLTKLMTAYVVFEAWKTAKVERTSKLTISALANSRPRARLGLGTGKVITFDEAMAALILFSANDIAVALAEAVAGSEAAFVDEMNITATRLGMASTRFINANGLPGEGQYSTARDLAIILRAIEDGRAASPAASREMLGILLAQEFNEKIPAGLPPGTRVAHKTGEITAVSHDAAIVYPPGRKPYVLVVLTRGITNGGKSSKLIADISAIVYSHSSAAAGAAFTRVAN